MEFQQPNKKGSRLGRDTQGMALMMVMSSIAVLSLLVTDFVYITQVSQAISYGGVDQAQAHYLAKSGLKLSLLRLKYYKQALNLASVGGKTGQGMIPKAALEKLWSFPFYYPFPTNLPGMSIGDRDIIKKFEKESGLEGKLSATIESESTKYNLNSLIPGFGPSAPPSAAPPPRPMGDPNKMSNQADPQAARTAMEETIRQIIFQKTQSDPDFGAIYRDFRVPELVDQMAAWADRKYERRTAPSRDPVPMKRAPFYSVAELHNLSMMDDELYQLLSPQFTTGYLANEINVNHIKEPVLRSLVPGMTKEEADEFFKIRDSDAADNTFKRADDFFAYISKFVAAYKGNDRGLNELKDSIKKKNITIITDESVFKITVQATVNSATRTIRAWVRLEEKSSTNLALDQTQLNPQGPNALPDSGLTIYFMRID